MEVEDYKRKITHTDYGKGETGLQQYAHGVNKVITEKDFFRISKELLENEKKTDANDKYLTIPTFSNSLPYIAGGGSFSYYIYIFNT
ncbi:hypothetical protein [Cellulophaga baltica]|uniref:Uncharacterized protein n=1 Tax=Cellulophaga baltica TaxID=76594 RepID=A0A1G7GCG3_9FLAO|nr:hypothetical protein [Cellulophaga baltica]SDE85842.1 hypothetical protein SAMN04487992_104288 [Cellulophaga baltica]